MLLGALLWLSGQSVIAQELELAKYDVVTISSVIPYADGAVSDLVRNECGWNTVMPAMLVIESRRTIVSTDEDLNVVQGKKLFIRVLHSRVIGGANFSGPKWIVLQGELMQDGELLGNFEFRRTTMGGKLSACKTLDYIGEALRKDILKWLKKPTKMATPKAKK